MCQGYLWWLYHNWPFYSRECLCVTNRQIDIVTYALFGPCELHGLLYKLQRTRRSPVVLMQRRCCCIHVPCYACSIRHIIVKTWVPHSWETKSTQNEQVIHEESMHSIDNFDTIVHFRISTLKRSPCTPIGTTIRPSACLDPYPCRRRHWWTSCCTAGASSRDLLEVSSFRAWQPWGCDSWPYRPWLTIREP